MARGEDES